MRHSKGTVKVAEKSAEEPPSRPPSWLSPVFAATVFLSAFLLFLVQPLVSRAILPWFGGTPGVWSVCMLFFQLVLFGGYAYSHLLTTRLSPRVRTAVHLGLLVVACSPLPILPSPEWKPTGEEDPTGRIVLTLLASVGLPFFVLATTGPLLQAWFAATHEGRSPYRLYALSNVGSLLALISYPFVVEPLLGLTNQSIVWSITFAVFAALCGLCGIASARNVPSPPGERARERGPQSGSVPRQGTQPADDPLTPTLSPGRGSLGAAPSIGTLALWFVLATIPSVMLLATTNQVCLDVASIPFLWVLPLSLYLLSFVLCFDSDRWYSRSKSGTAVLVTSGGILWAMAAGPEMSLVAQVVVYFAGLFAVAMFCHGELAALKPAPQHLTTFYLVMSAGGAAGGLFTALLAPRLFVGYYELPLAVLASAALVFVVERRARQLDPDHRGWSLPALGVIVLLLGCGLGLGVVRSHENVVHASRSFFGVLRVQDFEVGPKSEDKDPTAAGRRLLHGRITHGKQYGSPEWRDRSTMYYGPMSGVGLVLRARGAHLRCAESDERLAESETTGTSNRTPEVCPTLRVGAVGLGTGTLAVYAKPGDTYRFYEIDPDVIAVAQSHFDFLGRCQGTVEFATGDARLVLDREPPQQFDVLALDAFSSDAIPTHLLTREAMSIYLRHLADDGVLAFHVSNKHFDLEPVLAAHAETFGLSTAYANVLLDADEERVTGCTSSTWVLLSRDPAALAVGELAALPTLPTDERVAWTDDATNIVSVMRGSRWTKRFRNVVAASR